MSEIVRAIEHMLALPTGSLEGPGRQRVYTAARCLVAAILREHGQTFPQIGRKLGGRHHTSAMYLVDQYPASAEKYPKLAEIKALFNLNEPLVLSVRHAREQWVRDRNAAVIKDIRRNQPPIRIMKRHRLSITAYEQLAAQVRAGVMV